MESGTPSSKPPRSPWLYVLLGCGAFALLTCLGIGGVVAFGAKKVGDLAAGINDPKVREENARKLLGGIPEGYYVAASMNLMVFNMAVLVDTPPQEDGGFEMGDESDRAFMFFRVMAMEDNKQTKEFFTSDSNDTSGLAKKGIHIDATSIVKRGSFSLENRKMHYVSSRGSVGTSNGNQRERKGLNTAILFDCPGEQLYIGVWTQKDPAPEQAVEELDLTGTVADEAALKRFLSPVNPCGG